MAKASKAQLEANRRWREKNKAYNEYKKALNYMDNLINPDKDKNELIYKAIEKSEDQRFDYWDDMTNRLEEMADKFGYKVTKK
ncbi:hypothetical protein H5S09_03810 [Limosilactobacillus sp. STM2_1]|uniref:Phage protein n=1 Tax=Limosilactobacillus rudii TaxID=2759755 RepID=A0A7W3UK33_9LACO|nr:hypothetical protein [Limosilactobacillus rudii]MBB1079047.1 hypothetical protein [Limosilactobacillus rudii]MBB1097078.1 hypothetical protein [Limosilactobacillus rudii]MCD7134045.1 hypothetical protein [Limosilactobacillus rudii]